MAHEAVEAAEQIPARGARRVPDELEQSGQVLEVGHQHVEILHGSDCVREGPLADLLVRRVGGIGEPNRHPSIMPRRLPRVPNRRPCPAIRDDGRPKLG